VIRETGVFGDYRRGSIRKRAILAWKIRFVSLQRRNIRPDNFMNSHQNNFLNLQNLPARLTVEEAVRFLGFSPPHIAALL
jgi:hypothetical protein